MTELLVTAMKAASQLPDDEQDRIAQALFSLLDLHQDESPIDPRDRQAVLNALAEADRGEFATDEEVTEAFARFRR